MTPEYRVERLKGLIEELKSNGYKNVTEIATHFSMSASYISQLIGGHRGFGESAARTFEKKMGLPDFYFEQDVATPKTALKIAYIELNRFKSLGLGEQCQVNSKTVATRVVGGWIYAIDQEDDSRNQVVCFVPFTSQHDLNGMVDALIAKQEAEMAEDALDKK